MTLKYLIPVPREYQDIITQEFGENPNLYPSTNGHMGIDWYVPIGSDIYAAADGTVTRAELDTATAQNAKTGYGYHIRIQHADGTTSIYGHLVEGGILVRTGQQVRMGEVIGHSGSTGNSTGPHLHFEVRKGPAISTAFDPQPFLIREIPTDTATMEPIKNDPVLNPARPAEKNGAGFYMRALRFVNIRTGPSIDYKDIGDIERGQLVGPIVGIGGGKTGAWAHLADGSWVCVADNFVNIYLEEM